MPPLPRQFPGEFEQFYEAAGRAGCKAFGDSQQDAGVTLFQRASWGLDEGSDIPFAVGLDDILEDENAVVIIEWAEKLGGFSFPSKVFSIKIEGDGYEPRAITIDCYSEARRPKDCT